MLAKSVTDSQAETAFGFDPDGWCGAWGMKSSEAHEVSQFTGRRKQEVCVAQLV